MPYTPYKTVFRDTDGKRAETTLVSVYPYLQNGDVSLPVVPIIATTSFTTTGVSVEWTLPAKLYGTTIDFVVVGANGYSDVIPNSYGGNPGLGGQVTGTIDVSTLGTSLGLYVGNNGFVTTPSTSQRFGGELSAIWSPTITKYLCVAGGGGAGGPGNLGVANGGNGGNSIPGLAVSGQPSVLGGGGASSSNTGGAGGVGATSNGNSGTSLSSTPPTFYNAPLLTGGRGGGGGGKDYGGGGGDGWGGGGGGGYTATGTLSGGGGGGSNYVNATYVSSSTSTSGVDGATVTLTWLEYP
jgi:hypothetical protein